MEARALRLSSSDHWTYLGGDTDSKDAPECVLRAYDHPIEFATGATEREPDGEQTSVPRGEGRRLTGRHFFARPRSPAQSCRISVRGI